MPVENRTTMVLLLGIGAALLASNVGAERISRATSGTAPCGDDKAVRVLAVGGELQANSWCGKKVVHRDNTGKVIPGKTAQHERDAFKAAKDAERSRKKKADDERAGQAREAKQRAEAAKKEREAKRKDEERMRRSKEDSERKAAEERKKREQRCRGLGGGAACTEANPGKHGK